MSHRNALKQPAAEGSDGGGGGLGLRKFGAKPPKLPHPAATTVRSPAIASIIYREKFSKTNQTVRKRILSKFGWLRTQTCSDPSASASPTPRHSSRKHATGPFTC
eukprot:gene26029-biopygen13074